MSIIDVITSTIEPITKIIDKVHTSDHEKLQMKAELFKMQVTLYDKTLEYEKEIMKSRSAIIQAEAKGNSWLQRSWRPLTMLTFVGMLLSYWYGYAPSYLINNPQIMEKLMDILQLGIGGYIAGRSVEKIAKNININQIIKDK